MLQEKCMRDKKLWFLKKSCVTEGLCKMKKSYVWQKLHCDKSTCDKSKLVATTSKLRVTTSKLCVTKQVICDKSKLCVTKESYTQQKPVMGDTKYFVWQRQAMCGKDKLCVTVISFMWQRKVWYDKDNYEWQKTSLVWQKQDVCDKNITVTKIWVWQKHFVCLKTRKVWRKFMCDH